MTGIVGTLAVVVGLILLFALHQPPVEVAVNTLSLAVATIPESLPIVLTFALTLGARHMAARQAVVRRLSVVESENDRFAEPGRRWNPMIRTELQRPAHAMWPNSHAPELVISLPLVIPRAGRG